MIHRNPEIVTKASLIDYANVDEVCGYQSLLCKIFERAGGFSYPSVHNTVIRHVQNEACIWLKEVARVLESRLSGKPASPDPQDISSIPDLLGSYDIFYRLYNGEPCYDFIRRIKLLTADCWAKGNRSISATDVTVMLIEECERNVRAIDRRYSDFCLNTVGDWVKELTTNGRFSNISASESYKRLNCLIKTDLTAFLGLMTQQQLKKQWVNAFVVSDLQSLSTSALRQYIGFIRTAMTKGLCGGDDTVEQHRMLISELASRDDLHIYLRQAVKIELGEMAMADFDSEYNTKRNRLYKTI